MDWNVFKKRQGARLLSSLVVESVLSKEWEKDIAKSRWAKLIPAVKSVRRMKSRPFPGNSFILVTTLGENIFIVKIASLVVSIFLSFQLITYIYR